MSYTLKDVRFSSVPSTTVTSHREENGQTVVEGQTRTYNLVAEVTYEVLGWSDCGYCQAEICPITEVDLDSEGLIVNFTSYDYPDSQEVLEAIDEEIQKRMNSIIYSRNESSYNSTFVENMNQDPEYPKDPSVNTSSPFIYPI